MIPLVEVLLKTETYFRDRGIDTPRLDAELILAHVLCGRGKDMGTDIDRSLVKPPSGYHSVHGGPHKTRWSDDLATASEMWVVYDQAQSYPAYVLTYASRGYAALR